MQRSLVVGLFVISAVVGACRTEPNQPLPDGGPVDVPPGVDAPVGTDVPGFDLPPGQDVPPGTDVPSSTDGPGTDMPQKPVDTTISGIQDRSSPQAVPVGAIVRVSGVVAITRKTFISKRNQGTGCLYGIWVADPAGGPFSGIQVVAAGNDLPEGQEDCPAGNDPASGGVIPADAAIGDTFDIVGEYQEFLLSSAADDCAQAAGQTCTATYSQITAPFPGGTLMMTRTGTATPPAPVQVSADQLNDLKVRGVSNATTAMLRGTLVQLSNVTVTCANIGFGITAIEGTQCTEAMGGGDAGPFVPGSADGIYIQGQVDFDYSQRDQNYQQNDVLTTLIGVLNYNQFDGGWRITPRLMTDVVKAK